MSLKARLKEMRRLWFSVSRRRALLGARGCSSSTGEMGSTTAEIPWSVVQPFGSIRINLTKAFSEGWSHQDSFSSLLHSEFSELLQCHIS